MFNNIGKNLKTMSGIMFDISILGGIFSFVNAVSKRSVFSLIFVIVALFFSYLICFVIYVFGYLYDYLGVTNSNLYALASDKNRLPISTENSILKRR